MSKKLDYAETEWKAISSAPVAAGLLITLADASGPAGIAKEALAVGKAISDSALGNTPEVVKALAESVKSGGGRPPLPDVPMGDRAKTREALIGVIKTAVGALQKKSPGEVNSYKAWLASVAIKVAQASKAGGFLGMGGTEVSRNERAALAQLAGILGVNPRGAVAPT
jgi:hypothetical protein